MKGYESCRDGLQGGKTKFERLDVAQLIKHAFGMRTAAHTMCWAGKQPFFFTYMPSRSIGPEINVLSRKKLVCSIVLN
jgi:hypothetical protein